MSIDQTLNIIFFNFIILYYFKKLILFSIVTTFTYFDANITLVTKTLKLEITQKNSNNLKYLLART